MEYRSQQLDASHVRSNPQHEPEGAHRLSWRHWLGTALPPLLVIAGLLLLWELLVGWLALPDWLLPAPSQIGRTLVERLPILQGHITITLFEALVGLALGFVVGFGLALAIDASGLVRRALYPLLIVSQTIPIVAIAPLLIVGLGFGLLPKIIVVALVTFFPIAVNTVDGLQTADRDTVRLLLAMDASRWQLLRLVRLPAALPSILSGLKVAVTYSVIGAVLAEWIGANQGLGVYIARSLRSFRTDQVFVGALVTSLLTLALFGLVLALERWLTAWKRNTP
ncbi:MAG: ABC transporter permease [Chloroflexaceae bacterium]|nr:ABC transporter permease [Chloroflexaceae bacterium]NJO06871.1 ABC transporter permease [Chloroflexaceae bacterium]